MIEAEKMQGEFGTSHRARKLETTQKNDGRVVKGPKSQLEGTPNGQIWDNQSNKVIIEIDYNP